MVDSIQAPSDLVYCGDTIIISTSKALLELLIALSQCNKPVAQDYVNLSTPFI